MSTAREDKLRRIQAEIDQQLAELEELVLHRQSQDELQSLVAQFAHLKIARKRIGLVLESMSPSTHSWPTDGDTKSIQNLS